MRYSIVIPTHNRKNKLYNLMTSINSLTVKPEEVLVIDDASTDNSQDFMAIRFPGVKYFKLEKEKWPGFTISYGIAKAKNDLIYIIDDDNVVNDSTVLPILLNFEQDTEKKIGVIGPVTCWLKNKDRIMYGGAVYNRLTSTPKALYKGESYTNLMKNITKIDEMVEVDGIPNAFMLRRSYAILAGLIPQYIPIQGEDGYLIYSIKKILKKSVYVCLTSRIYHDYEETGRMSDVRLYYSIRTKILFIKERFSFFRAVLNLFFMPAFILYYGYRSLKLNPKNPRIALILLALRDGILGVRKRRLIDE